MTKKEVVFLGFTKDYHKMECDSVSDLYNTTIINIPAFFKLFKIFNIFGFNIKNIFEKKWLYNKLNSFKCPIVLMMDNDRYINIMKGREGLKIILIRDIDNKVSKSLLDEFSIYSFDSFECEKLGYKKYKQYNSGYNYIVNSSFKLKYDFSFIGRNKGREKYLNDFFISLDGSYKYDKLIIEELSYFKSIISSIPFIKQKKLAYKDYLDRILSAKCILDIVQDGQTSETMRLTESLLANRKVITNNKRILDHELYNKNNILYLREGKNIKNKINEFMESDFICYDTDIILKYSPRYVLSSIIESEIQ
ncbi:hypothetical protein I3271_19090 [Photobacterium leiognathi]|uniref:hypothetical protein n=1 Tax=Photobacterium leiognathi TaxID=553611 RepID=UPI001EDE40C9|nr:hypothetical protein [Photobacterium leiognathi]MCG3886784.1 hypothetical protein [Photobacterium leiognathi]